jgi:hypothetical protein
MINVQILIFYVLIYKLFTYVLGLDLYDRTHPYGLDKKRNSEKTPDKVGERYGGPTVFWGINSKKDTVKKSLDKLQWLVDSQDRTVEWRRALLTSILITMISTVALIPEKLLIPSYILNKILIVFLFIYAYTTYQKYHVNYQRNRQMLLNISHIKRKLRLSYYNHLESIII